MRLLLLLLPLGLLAEAPDDFYLSCKGKEWFSNDKLVLKHDKETVINKNKVTETYYRGFLDGDYISSYITFHSKNDDYYSFGNVPYTNTYYGSSFGNRYKYYSPIVINRETLELQFKWSANNMVDLNCKQITHGKFWDLYNGFQAEHDKNKTDEKERIKKKNKI